MAKKRARKAQPAQARITLSASECQRSIRPDRPKPVENLTSALFLVAFAALAWKETLRLPLGDRERHNREALRNKLGQALALLDGVEALLHDGVTWTAGTRRMLLDLETITRIAPTMLNCPERIVKNLLPLSSDAFGRARFLEAATLTTADPPGDLLNREQAAERFEAIAVELERLPPGSIEALIPGLAHWTMQAGELLADAVAGGLVHAPPGFADRVDTLRAERDQHTLVPAHLRPRDNEHLAAFKDWRVRCFVDFAVRELGIRDLGGAFDTRNADDSGQRLMYGERARLVARACRALAARLGGGDAKHPALPAGNADHATPTDPTMHDLASEAGISDDTFRRVREAAGIAVESKGAAARNRRYPPSEVDRLIAAARAGNFIERAGMAEKWARWGSK